MVGKQQQSMDQTLLGTEMCSRVAEAGSPGTTDSREHVHQLQWRQDQLALVCLQWNQRANARFV